MTQWGLKPVTLKKTERRKAGNHGVTGRQRRGSRPQVKEKKKAVNGN